MDTLKRYYRIERNEISYLRFILEAYDGVGVLTTIDAAAGIVVLRVAPDCRAEVEMILQDLKREILIEALEETEVEGSRLGGREAGKEEQGLKTGSGD